MANINQITVSGTTYDVEDTTARNELTNKANTSSPSFTGTPTAPTAIKGTNTTQIATTAFVQAAVQGGGAVTSVDGQTGAVITNAVRYTSQSLTTSQKTQARSNIGAGTSNFSGSYNDLTDKPNIPGEYTLPVASATTLGGVKPIAKTAAMTQYVGVDANGVLYTMPGSGSGGVEQLIVPIQYGGQGQYVSETSYDDILQAIEDSKIVYGLMIDSSGRFERIMPIAHFNYDIDASSVTFYSIDEDTIYTFTITQGITPTYATNKTYHMLPLVSSEDNGKILKVVNGTWTAANA